MTDNNASDQNASKRRMLDKMKQPLEILIKLKSMFMSYAELFNGSITEKAMRSFWSPQKGCRLKFSCITFMQCYAERYFFILLPYPHNSA